MKLFVLKGLVLIAFIVMMVFNVLANTLPLNNQTTGAISDRYPSLFTPAGITFSIWGVIYLLLGIYVVRTLLMQADTISDTFKEPLMIIFIVSALFNTLWLFMWHYERMFLSTLVIIMLLITLAFAFMIIPSEEGLTRTTFSLYFGWVSIATIANITILLVSRNFSGFGISEAVWFGIILIVGVVLLSIVLYQQGDVIYGLVFIWAYFGIFLRHYTQENLLEPHPYLTFYSLLMTIFIVGLTAYTYLINNFQFFRD